MTIDDKTTPEAAVEELAHRMARLRVERGITQAELAGMAGVGKSTIERIERGHDTQLSTLIRLLRVLGLSDRIDQLIPESTISPMDQLRGITEPPQRARRKKATEPDRPWTWGDER